MLGVSVDTRGADTLSPKPAWWLRALGGALVCASLWAGDPWGAVFVSRASAESESFSSGAGSLRGDGIEEDWKDEPLAAVWVEGNTTIPGEQIAKHIKTRAGRPPIPKQVKDDVRALHATRWFFTVESRYKRTDDGLVLVFKVLERPILQRVEYKGNKKIKTKDLVALTNLKAGGAYDENVNREAARRIESHYHEKSFVYAKVELEKGNTKADREVVFKITEGPKVHVSKVDFSGNKDFSDRLLKTKLKTKTQILWLFGGKYDPASIPEDIAAIKEYYHSLGYFNVKITEHIKASSASPKVEIEYKVDEGERFKVRHIAFAGNQVLKEADLRKNTKQFSNDYFNERKLKNDVEKITNQYQELGRIFTRVEAVPQFFEESGTLDLVYHIDESEPHRIRRINVHIEGEHPHTKESTLLTRMLVKPGDLADLTKIRKSETRLAGSQLFGGSQPGSGDAPKITVRKGDSDLNRDPDRPSIVRAQGTSDSNAPYNPIFQNNPQGDPLADTLTGPPPNFVDLDVRASEGQTGRLMFGVGINSNAGLVGSAVLDENNFDITRPPHSFQDITDGTAFRGGGQQFRLEAMPGNQVSRYMLTWRDPYFLDQNFSLGASGFYYTRFFPDWYETRAGGRLTVGQQFTPYLSASAALRGESVTVQNPTVPTPDLLTQSLGDNFLSTIRLSVAHDTRDRAFLAGHGHFLEASYEQGFGEFTYPRAEVEGRQYFTVRERPDGGGRQIVTLSGQVAYTGSQTPIFERFFAGGFGSFRGFRFRGVTPRDLGVGIGGQWLALGTAEYMIPITADDAIQVVTFTDFGTIENNVSFNNFRVTVGAGFRVTIPAMGPFPIAIDFAVPVVREDFDNLQVVSFSVGMQR